MERQQEITECIKENWYHVYGVVRGIILNRDDALDVLQEVFVKLHMHWNSLRDRSKVRSWLGAVARTTSYDHIRKSNDGNIHYDEETLGLFSKLEGPVEAAVSAETKAEVRRAVDLVDSHHRDVVRRYYFDNQKIADIARVSGEPVGTIKWRLSKARELLRKEFLMSEIATLHNDVPRFPRLHVDTIWGYNGPNVHLRPRNVCKSLLAQQVLLSIRKQYKTAEEIAKVVKAETAYVEDQLADMVASEIVRMEGRAYRANCIVFDADDERKILDARREVGKKVANLISQRLRGIDSIVERFTGNAPTQNSNMLRWIVLGVFLLNRGLTRKLTERNPELAIIPPGRPDGGRWCFLPRLEQTLVPVEMGCNTNDNDDPDNFIGISRYWNSDYYRRNSRQKKSVLPIVSLLVNGPVDTGTMLESIDEEDLAAAKELGYITTKSGVVSLNIPLFTETDGDFILGILDPIAEEIMDTALAEFPGDVYELFDSLGYGFLKSDYSARIHNLRALATLRELCDRGVLIAPSKNRLVSWGTFALKGRFTPMQLE